MTFVVADRVKDSTTTTGTGTVTLSGSAPSGFQSFGSVMANGDTCYYVIAAGSEWEVGLGTYGSSGPTLARTTVLASSNSGSAVSFSAGSKDVFLDAPGQWMRNVDAGRLVSNVYNSIAGAGGCIPGVANINVATSIYAKDTDWFFPILAEGYLTFDQVICEVTTDSGSGGSTGRIALTAADATWQPSGSLIEDFGTFATDSTGVKTVAPSAGSRTLPPGRYLLVLNVSGGGTTFRVIRGSLNTGLLATGLGANPTPHTLSVGRSHAAFPSPIPAWTTAGAQNQPFYYPTVLRVTAVTAA